MKFNVQVHSTSLHALDVTVDGETTKVNPGNNIEFEAEPESEIEVELSDVEEPPMDEPVEKAE